jgi:hypothetical protein
MGMRMRAKIMMQDWTASVIETELKPPTVSQM